MRCNQLRAWHSTAALHTAIHCMYSDSSTNRSQNNVAAGWVMKTLSTATSSASTITLSTARPLQKSGSRSAGARGVSTVMAAVLSCRRRWSSGRHGHPHV